MCPAVVRYRVCAVACRGSCPVVIRSRGLALFGGVKGGGWVGGWPALSCVAACLFSSPLPLISFWCSFLSTVLLSDPRFVPRVGRRWSLMAPRRGDAGEGGSLLLVASFPFFGVRFVMADQFWILAAYCLQIHCSSRRWARSVAPLVDPWAIFLLTRFPLSA